MSTDPFAEFRPSGTIQTKSADSFDEFRAHAHTKTELGAFKGLHEQAKDAPRTEAYPEFRATDDTVTQAEKTDAFSDFRPHSGDVTPHDDFPEMRAPGHSASASSAVSTPSAEPPAKPLS
ncbi:hypothetical protein EXIGLDRAFT_733256 [Exidia glandulosa HHB12029]|uniref:Uncharacterized protein n=1 Tax=Exidia glandulosa HHB12029 TaxID=1314781 RepID=A0A165BCJ8_EXIGL|nr:hypothetical protein EXIGLDRAFT_733256 [Exidia glandulosa HHB12029]